MAGALLWMPAAHAEICKYTDAAGTTLYSNVSPGSGWKRQSCIVGDDGPSSTPAPKGSASATRSTPSPAGFPKVDSQTQRGRDDIRRKVLAEELAAEERLLADARATYADGAPTPLPEEKADAEKYRVRIGRLRQSLAVHEKNVEALKKELGSVK